MCGVFFFLGPGLATLLLPFFFLPKVGDVLFWVWGILVGGGRVNPESGWVRLGRLSGSGRGCLAGGGGD